MNKTLKTLALAGSMLAVATSAQAMNKANIRLDSPVIYKADCELIGNLTVSIDEGTLLEEGDWFIMDLPDNTTFCKDINYMITGGVTSGAAVDTVYYDGGSALPIVQNNVFLNSNGTANTVGTAAAITPAVLSFLGAAPPAVPSNPLGPLSIADETGVLATAGITAAGNGVVLHVKAVSGTRTLTIKVLGVDTPVYADVLNNTTGGAGVDGIDDGYSDATTFGGVNDSILVDNDAAFVIALGDGEKYNTEIVLNTDPTSGTATTKVWGDLAADSITSGNTPHSQTSFCANASAMAGSLMFVSFDSSNSLNMTFSGDSQIAHAASATSITLQNCDKAALSIEIADQNLCQFNYDTGNGYCGTFAGSRLYLESASTFGNSDDKYDVSIVSETTGVYFGGTASIVGFLTTEDACTDAGTTVTATTKAATRTNTSTVEAPDASCTITSTKQINKVSTSGGAIQNINNFDALWVKLPTMYYDTGVIGDGTEVDITINLDKYPCGNIFNDDTTLGTFVTLCPTTSATGTDLLFPFMPAINGAGWWGGFTIVNGGSGSGSCDLTMTTENGMTATGTTGNIAAGAHWNAYALSDLLAASTTSSADFGDENFAIAADCDFARAGGFAFIGNNLFEGEGTGYTAYVLGGDGWQ